MRKQALTEKWDMTSVDSNEGKKCTGTRIQYCKIYNQGLESFG